MLLKNTILYSISNSVIRISNILFLPWLTAYFSLADIGLYFIVLVLAEVLFSVSSIGTHFALGRFLPESIKNKTGKDCFANCFGISIIGGLVLFFVIRLLYLLFPSFLFSSSIELSYVIWFFVISQQFATLFLVSIKAQEKALVYSIISIVGTSIELIGYYLIFQKANMQIYHLIFISSLKWLVIALLAAIVQRNFIAIKLNKVWLRQLIPYGLALMPAGLLLWVVTSSDRYWLDYFISKELVGLYGMLLRILMPFTVLIGSYMMSLDASIFNLEKKKGLIEINKRIKEFPIYFGVLLLIASFIVQIILTWVSDYFSLFPENYKLLVNFVPLVFCSVYLYFAGDHFATYLELEYKSKQIFISLIFASLINLVLAGLLINFYKDNSIFAIGGALIATVIAWLLRLFILEYFIRIKSLLKFNLKILLFVVLFVIQTFYLF